MSSALLVPKNALFFSRNQIKHFPYKLQNWVKVKVVIKLYETNLMGNESDEGINHILIGSNRKQDFARIWISFSIQTV